MVHITQAWQGPHLKLGQPQGESVGATGHQHSGFDPRYVVRLESWGSRGSCSILPLLPPRAPRQNAVGLSVPSALAFSSDVTPPPGSPP